jgi:predicted esterase YcpF (UPF0227 family)
MENDIYNKNQVFWWEKRWFYYGGPVEAPVYSSVRDAQGSLIDIIKVLRDSRHSNLSSCSSSTSSATSKYITKTQQWRAVSVAWDSAAATELIFVINDYEQFFKDPLNNGVYVDADTEKLLENDIDNKDQIFFWEKRWFNDGTTEEAPTPSSVKDAQGLLKSIIKLLRDSRYSSLSSCSSSMSSSISKYITSTRKWKAVVVEWDHTSNTQLVFIIDNIENFYRDPLNNGTFMTINTELLMENDVDNQDQVFWLEKRWFNDGTTEEGPIYASVDYAQGAMKDAIKMLRDSRHSSLSSCSSSMSSVANKQITKTYEWRSVTVEWDATADTQTVFIINDFENFYRDPLNSGVFKDINTELLMESNIDNKDQIFFWEELWFSDGSTTETPVLSSVKDARGLLKKTIKFLRGSRHSSLSSCSSSMSSMASKYITSTCKWKSVVVDWDCTADVQLAFIIDNIENFYRDPLNSGTFKDISKELLMENNIDAKDQAFWFEKRWFNDGTTEEGPINSSATDAQGLLKDAIKTLRDSRHSSLSSCSSSMSSVANKQIISDYRWRAVSVVWDHSAATQLIFIINDYEQFFRDPVNNGIYMEVATELLLENGVEAQDQIFFWEKQWFSDSTTAEAPVFYSSKDAQGELLDKIQIIRDYAP